MTDIKNLGPIFGSLFLECGSVCLVTSIDEKGVPNIITCSSVFPIQSGYVGVLVGFTRHSYKLIKTWGEFAVNLPSRDIREEVMCCGTHTGIEYRKFEECHLTPKKARKIKPPVIRECVVWLECENYSAAHTESHTFFIGRVVSAYAREEALDVLFDPMKNLNKWSLLSKYSSESTMKKLCEETGADFHMVREFWQRYYNVWGGRWLKE